MTGITIPSGQKAIRGFAALLLAAGLLFSGALANAIPATAQARPAVGAVEVDVSALRAKGAGVFAEILGDALQRELQAIYRTGQPGPRLVVRLESYFLTGNLDSGDSFDRSFSTDSLSGTNLLVDGSGAVIDSFPLSVRSPVDMASSIYRPGIEQDRAISLARIYAQWLARRI